MAISFRSLDERMEVSLWYEYKLGNNGTVAYTNLIKAYGPMSISKWTVWKRFKEFRYKNENSARKGISKDPVTSNAVASKNTHKQCPGITSKDPAENVDASTSAICSHLSSIAKEQKHKTAISKRLRKNVPSPMNTPPAQRYPTGYPVYIPKVNQTRFRLAHKFASSGGARSVADMLERLAGREEIEVLTPAIGTSKIKPVGFSHDKKGVVLCDEDEEIKECITYLL